MKSVNFVLIVLTAYAVNIKRTCTLRVDIMDAYEDRINLKDPSWPFSSSGILKSHSGFQYTANRNKTLILSAPPGCSIFAAVRLLDLRPNGQDYLTLFANKTARPATFLNTYSYQRRKFDIYENELTYYAPDGQLGVTFYTGPNPVTWEYDGFEVLYTVQGNWSKCPFDTFRCFNGRCISRSLKCDGHNHCGDRSDQNDCTFPEPIRPRGGRIAGVVGGVVLLLIAVACAIYIVIRRAKLRQTETRTIVNQHPPPTNIQGYPPPYPGPGVNYSSPPPPYSSVQGATNPAYK